MTDHNYVLYVDDDPDLLELGKRFLERNKEYTVTVLNSAFEALDILEKQPFDAIISDYQMPGMDGIEFLREVRSSGKAIPFILFTGRGREEVVIQALNEGADFYLQKGGDPRSQFAELSHKIHQAVRQRRLETSIRNHERRETDIINFLPDSTFAINTDGIIIAWNQAMEALTGLSSARMIGLGNFEYALPFYHERRPLLLDLILRDDPVTYSKYSSIKRDGEHLSAEITISHFHEGTGASFWFTASPLYDNLGVVVGAIESIREITEIKRAEAALRLDESRLEVLLKLNQMISEPMNDITNFALEQAVRLTESTLGYIAFVNEDESVLTMHAWSRAAMHECQIQKKPLTYPVESTGLWGESIRQRSPVITNDYKAPSLLKKGTPEGHVDLIRHLSVPVFDRDRIVVVAGVGNKSDNYGSSDIRQLELLIGGMWTIISRKQVEQELLRNHEELQAAYEEISATEEELRFHLDELTRQDEILRESGRQLNSMATNIPGVVYRFYVNPDGTYGFDYISERSMQILGLPNDLSTFFDNISKGIIQKDRDRFIRSVQHAIRTRTLWEFDGQYVKPSGEKIWVHAVSSPVIENNHLIFDGVIFDNTDRKQAEIEIRKKNEELYASYEKIAAGEKQFRNLLSSMPENVMVHKDGVIVYANQMAAEMTGFSKEELIGSRLGDIITQKDQEMVLRNLGQQDAGDQFGYYEIDMIHKSGALYHVILRSAPIVFNLIPSVVTILIDISDRKRDEKALLESENLYLTVSEPTEAASNNDHNS